MEGEGRGGRGGRRLVLAVEEGLKRKFVDVKKSGNRDESYNQKQKSESRR